jgi:hypothetical protein
VWVAAFVGDRAQAVELSATDVESRDDGIGGDWRHVLDSARPLPRLVANTGEPAVPVVGEGGSRGGLAASVFALTAPIDAFGALGVLGDSGASRNAMEFEGPAVFSIS